METLRVRAGKLFYDVMVGRGAWRELRKLDCSVYTSVFVLTEKDLWRSWGEKFRRAVGWNTLGVILVPRGETSKSLRYVEHVAGELLEGGADRRSLLIAFGGGVIGDLGGFVASTYMRGIDYVQVPTTVVAQVDSAIGGKTAVNVGAMKNLVGTFAPPRLVLAEPNVLGTLPLRAFRSGLYEVVKHAILSGPKFFGELESKLDSLIPQNASNLGPVLARAAQVKVDVVSSDEREAGLRRVLNLGHTFGHALEEITQYRRFLHGEAVGWGMLVAVRLAEMTQCLQPADGRRIATLVRRVGMLPPIDDLSAERIVSLLARDKKSVGGKLHWVLPERLGKVRIVSDISAATSKAAFREVQKTRFP